MLPLVLIGTLSVSACVSRDVIIEHQTIVITEPEIYQHCLTEPVAPAIGASNKAWKDYQLELKRYGNDCEGKVVGGREWSKRHALKQTNPADKKPSPTSNPLEEEAPAETSLWDKVFGNKAVAPKKE
jgi:hypothetical protein